MASTTNSNSPDFWKISAEERAKHNATFNQLNPDANGYLSGEQAKAFLIKSGLPPQTLAQIWNLADLNKDGKLDKKEFSIACFLVKKTLNGVSVPLNIPPTLLVDPPQAVIDMNKSTTTLHHPSAPPPLSTSQPNLFSSLLQPSTTTTSTTNRTATPVIPMTTMLPSAPLFPLTTTTTTASSIPLINSTMQQQPSIFPPMPLLTTAAPASIMPLGSLPATLSNPSIQTIGGGIPPIPTTSRNKFSQIFQSNDPSSSGYLNGSQAKMLLMQTGLAQQLLAQIWQLSDFDNDGRLSHEEFILAMHLCDYAKSGNVLPTHLPVELQPTRARTTSLIQPIASITPPPPTQPILQPAAAAAAINNDPNAAKTTIASFEDKRKENFDRGNAVLEAKRQMLRDQAEREKREREDKERLEQERKQKIKDEQEKKRLADLEKQRLIEAQRDDERKKAIEQREAARQELLRQQRIEWEIQRRNELEIQRVKLQEQISILKAKDKNLEYEMQLLNDKITSSKQKIRDTQSNLSELNIHIDTVKKSLDKKMSDCEVNERYVKDYTESLRKSNQEKLYLSEKLKNMNQDNPFAETYRNESLQYKQEQTALQQMKDESHRLDVDISTMRTQIECLKHEIEQSKVENVDILKQNERIVNTLLNLKRNDFKQKYPTVQVPQISQIKVTSNKDNYDAFKEEINKIQITSANNSLSVNNNSNTTPITTTTSTTMPNISTNSNVNNNSTSANAATISSIVTMLPNSNSNGKIANSNDVWSSGFDNSTINDDPFKMLSNNEDPFNSNEDPFMSLNNNGTNNDPFSANFADNNIDPFNENNSNNSQQNDGEIWGFNNNNSNHANLNNNNNFNSNNDSNWASFDDAFNTFNQQSQQQKSVKNTPINSQVTSPTSPTSPTNRQQQIDDSSSNAHIKDIIQKFNTQTTISPPKYQPHSTQVQPNDIKHAAINGKNGLTPTQSKCRALFRFDGERSDELSLVEGDIIIVDTAVKSDDGWSWGSCKGRCGVFPSNYAEKLTDLEVIHEEQSFNTSSTNQMQLSQPHTNGGAPTATYQNIVDSQQPINSTQSMRVVTIAAYSAKKENHLTFGKGDVITVREQNGAWWSGELNGKIGWFPPNYVKPIENHPDVVPNYQLPVSGHHEPSIDINNYISLFAFETNEPGDLNFGQYEIINVVDMKDEWYTGVIESTKQKGIFPSNFVKKFGFPIDYIHKFGFAIAAQDHFGQTEQELSINVNDIIAIMQLSPDNQWSYGEKFDELTNQTKRGWFLTENAVPIQISTNNNSATTIAHNTTTTTTTPNNKINTTITTTTTTHTSASTLNNTTTNNNNNLYANVVMTNNNHDNNNGTPPSSSSNSTNYYNNIAATTTTHTTVNDNLTAASNKKFQEVVTSNDHQQQQQQPYSQQAEVVVEHQVVDQVIALYDFQSTIPDAISFPKDAIIKIFKKDGDWLTGEYNGLCGILPSNYVQSIDQNHQLLTNNSSENTNRKKLKKKEIIDRDYNSFESDEEEVNDSEMNNSDTIAEKLRMRSNVIKEILQTEVNYIQNLNKVVELYYNPLMYNKVLTDQELHTIFINWHQIIDINTKFQNSILHRIEETKRQKQTVVHIGDILLTYLPKMKPYCEFVSGRQFGEELIMEKMKTSPEFNDIMNKTSAGDSGEFILKKLLILPMQRVTQYSLLIDKLLKYVDESDDDYPKLKKSSKVAVDLIKMINDEVGKKHDFDRLQWLEEHVPQARSIGLKFDSSTNFMGERRLLYYGPFVKESGKELFGFLFNDILLIIEASQSITNEIFKSKTKQFQIYKTPMMLDTIRAVQSRIGQSNMDTSFQIVTEREFLFRTSNPTLKSEWIKQLQKAIQEYKEKKIATSQGNTPIPISKTPVGRLLLIVMEAQDLYMELGEEQKPNSFCEVKMGIGQKFFTQTIDGSANPKWNISLQFQIYDLKKDVLTATVYDQKIYSPNKCLGKINLSITQIYKEQLKENNPVTRVFPLTETKSGKIMLKMNITMYQ